MRGIFLAIFLATLVVWLGYEIVALTNKQPGDTISEIAWSLVSRPIFPFLTGLVVGLLSGHFFWQRL